MMGRVLLKSRMRQNFTSGSVRGLIVTSKPRIRHEVQLSGSTRHSTIGEKHSDF